MKIAKLTALFTFEFDTMDHTTEERFETFCIEHEMRNELDGQRLPRNVRLLTKDTENAKAFEELARHYAANAFGLEVKTGRCACFLFVEDLVVDGHRAAPKTYRFFQHEHTAEGAWKEAVDVLKNKYGNDMPDDGAKG